MKVSDGNIVHALKDLGGIASGFEIYTELGITASVDRERVRSKILNLANAGVIDKIAYKDAVELSSRTMKNGNKGVTKWAYKTKSG